MLQTVSMRERQIHLRLNAEEGGKLDAVAAHHGLDAQAVLRFLIQKEAREIGAAGPKLGAKKKAQK